MLQMWSVQSGLLLCSCRGHTSEITDIAVSADNTQVATCSNDRSVRVWSLQVLTNGLHATFICA